MIINYYKSILFELLIKNSVKIGKFKLASGVTTDFYIDCRKSTMTKLGMFAIEGLCENLIPEYTKVYGAAKSVGGLTMGADMVAFCMARKMGLDVFSVRKEPKKYGTHSLIEGCLGDSVIVVDDVITSGGSIEKAVDVVKKENCKVNFIFTLIDRQEGGKEYIENKYNIPVFSVFTKKELMV